MHKPRKDFLDVLVPSGAYPVDETSNGQQRWVIFPEGETNMPPLVMVFSILEKTQISKRAIQAEIDRYLKLCKVPIYRLSPEHRSCLYVVTMVHFGDFQKGIRPVSREFLVFPEGDPIWLQISLAWTTFDWYVDLRTRAEGES